MSDYDSFYLMPTGVSNVTSRSQVDIKSGFYGVYPIFSSPMKGISGSELVIEMGRNNCFGILHRFDTPETRVKNIHIIADAKVPYGVAIGMNDFDIELDIASCAYEHDVKLICVDVANGYNKNLENIGKRLRSRFGKHLHLMSGNVIDKVGAQFLLDSGFDFVRIGIGGSAFCSTREKTGVGRNNLFAVKDCFDIPVNLVCDGGVNTPGKAVKSFAFGADYVMLGTALAYANESESKGNFYFGMASRTNHELNNKEIKSIEGKEIEIDPSKKKPLKEILDDYLWGTRSACAYLDCQTYKQLTYKAQKIGVNE